MTIWTHGSIQSVQVGPAVHCLLALFSHGFSASTVTPLLQTLSGTQNQKALWWQQGMAVSRGKERFSRRPSLYIYSVKVVVSCRPSLYAYVFVSGKRFTLNATACETVHASRTQRTKSAGSHNGVQIRLPELCFCSGNRCSGTGQWPFSQRRLPKLKFGKQALLPKLNFGTTCVASKSEFWILRPATSVCVYYMYDDDVVYGF